MIEGTDELLQHPHIENIPLTPEEAVEPALRSLIPKGALG